MRKMLITCLLSVLLLGCSSGASQKERDMEKARKAGENIGKRMIDKLGDND